MIHNAGALKVDNFTNTFMIMLTLVTASTFLMWMGDRITVHGVGNGVSLLIFVNIISRFPASALQVFQLQKAEEINIVSIIAFAAAGIALLIAVIYMTLAERRITVQYAGKTVGNKTFKGQSTHIPITMTASAVIAIIFAMSVMQFPATIGQFWQTSWFNKVFVNGHWSPFRSNTWEYALMYAVLTIFFTWFYTQVTFKPDEMAENMHKSSGFIPGIRPGQPTAAHIERILVRVSIIGGCFAAVIAISPVLVAGYTSFKNISFGGTALLIMVGVALDVMRQLESQLVMRHYQGFLK
jgi:preprotein translocase subunit SecY